MATLPHPNKLDEKKESGKVEQHDQGQSTFCCYLHFAGQHRFCLPKINSNYIGKSGQEDKEIEKGKEEEEKTSTSRPLRISFLLSSVFIFLFCSLPNFGGEKTISRLNDGLL